MTIDEALKQLHEVLGDDKLTPAQRDNARNIDPFDFYDDTNSDLTLAEYREAEKLGNFVRDTITDLINEYSNPNPSIKEEFVSKECAWEHYTEHCLNWIPAEDELPVDDENDQFLSPRDKKRKDAFYTTLKGYEYDADVKLDIRYDFVKFQDYLDYEKVLMKSVEDVYSFGNENNLFLVNTLEPENAQDMVQALVNSIKDRTILVFDIGCGFHDFKGKNGTRRNCIIAIHFDANDQTKMYGKDTCTFHIINEERKTISIFPVPLVTTFEKLKGIVNKYHDNKTLKKLLSKVNF